MSIMAVLLGTMMFAIPNVSSVMAGQQTVGIGAEVVSAQSQTSNSQSQTLVCTYNDGHGPVRITYYHTTSQTCPDLILKHHHSHDPQFGYTSTASYGNKGINDKQVAINWILTHSIGIGQAFYDNNGNWFHNGIGENTDATCTNPPEIFGEYSLEGSGTFNNVGLVCPHYGDTEQISTVYDSYINEFAWFVNGTERASVSFSGEGSTVGNSTYPYSYDFIETASTSPACPGTTYTPYNHAFEYATSAAYNGSPPTFYDPTSGTIGTWNPGNAWPTTCWLESNSGSTPYSISYGPR